jgi:cardiolipin synthase (CMP-forming)
MNIPNLISIMRLTLVPLVVWAISQQHYTIAFWTFVIAGVSDAIDGFIARQFNMHTELGAYLDPLADKALLMSIYVTLAITHAVPLWIALVVFSRDVMIMGAVVVSWLMEKPIEIRPSILSKANTTAQIAFAALILAGLSLNYALDNIINTTIWGVAATTVLSALHYLYEWLNHMNQN